MKFFSDLSLQGFKGRVIDCASQLSITATMTTLWENSNNNSSSRCLRHMLTIYLLIFAGICQLNEAGATTRKSLNCQVFTLYLIYNNTTEHRVLSSYLHTVSRSVYMLDTNNVNPPAGVSALSVDDLIELYKYRYVDNYCLHQAEQQRLVQPKETQGRQREDAFALPQL